MPHRVEPYPTSRPPSTPAERSDARRSPPPPGTDTPPPPAHGPPPAQHGHYAYNYPGGYMYAPPPHPLSYVYASPPAPCPMQCGGYVRYARAQSAPPQITPPGPVDASSAPVQVVHTDDAGTKLSNLVRRRCFNCCTTETSTWRRSNLSSGKVLCNKCGLFERTHSRARPEQFPLKRRPPAPSTVQLRSPHGATESQPTHQQRPYRDPSSVLVRPPGQYMITTATPPPNTNPTSPPNPNHPAPAIASAPSSAVSAPGSHSKPDQTGSVSHPGTPPPGATTNVDREAPATNTNGVSGTEKGAPASASEREDESKDRKRAAAQDE